MYLSFKFLPKEFPRVQDFSGSDNAMERFRIVKYVFIAVVELRFFIEFNTKLTVYNTGEENPIELKICQYRTNII